MVRTRTSPRRILGIDPGLETTGYGAIDAGGSDAAVVEAGVIQTDPKDPMPQRLARLAGELGELLAELKPDLAAVEKLYAHYRHPRTAILMGHARGVILSACAAAGVEVRDLPATSVKRALTGNGHASKEQVQKAVTVELALREVPEPADVADALAIALCAARKTAHGADSTGLPQKVEP